MPSGQYACTMMGVIVARVGYAILLCQQRVSIGVRNLAISLVVNGGSITQPVTLAWLSNNISGQDNTPPHAPCKLVSGIWGASWLNIFLQS